MGIAEKMDLDPAITAGAVISGAYFGDKSSPLSDTANLAGAAAGSNLYDHVRESLWTSVPSLVIALALFWSLGSAGDFEFVGGDGADRSGVSSLARAFPAARAGAGARTSPLAALRHRLSRRSRRRPACPADRPRTGRRSCRLWPLRRSSAAQGHLGSARHRQCLCHRRAGCDQLLSRGARDDAFRGLFGEELVGDLVDSLPGGALTPCRSARRPCRWA